MVRKLAVTPCGTADEDARLVQVRHGEAVDLELRDVGKPVGRLRGRREAEALADPGIERPELVGAEGVRQAEHRPLVADLREPAPRRGAAHPLRGRGRGDERRKRRLEGDQAPEELVVLRVRELGRVLLVVEAVGTVNPSGEVRVERRGLVDGEGGHLLDEGRVDG
jgi:hypothetical protein